MIGIRHGEKLYETLLSREEMAKAEDRGDYFRVPLDDRSLDYGLYFEHGDSEHGELEDYTSHNTERLDVDEVMSRAGTPPGAGRGTRDPLPMKIADHRFCRVPRLASSMSSGALTEHEVVPLGRRAFDDPGELARLLGGVDAVIHCAGSTVLTHEELVDGNRALARRLTEALDAADVRPTVVYANSIHSGSATPFGAGKEQAGEHLASWAARAGSTFSDVRLPNLFGEHGRPHYNSVIATFCHQLAAR